HGPHASRPSPPPGVEKSHAVLWLPMPRAGACLCALGAPNGTELLELGAPIPALGQQAQQLLAQAPTLSDVQRTRVAEAFNAALSRHTYIRKQSTQLVRGHTLRHYKLVNAYDLTIAPIVKGKSNCPAQFGRKPGLASEPATGFIFANLVPPGNPSDA